MTDTPTQAQADARAAETARTIEWHRALLAQACSPMTTVTKRGVTAAVIDSTVGLP